MLQIDLPADAAEQACRRAISDLGWRLLEDDGRRLVVKEVSPKATSFTWAAKVEVVVEEASAGSEVLLNGSITGMGPVQKGHLRGQLGALRNKIDLAAQDAAADDGTAGGGVGEISGELERLAGLHQSGVLTDEEFAQAKAQLLERR
jgi:hypothetical protein